MRNEFPRDSFPFDRVYCYSLVMVGYLVTHFCTVCLTVKGNGVLCNCKGLFDPLAGDDLK